MLTFLHITDTHISADPAYAPPWMEAGYPHPNRGVDLLHAALSQLPFNPDFILHTGDVAAEPEAQNYVCAREMLLQFPLPMYCLPGNHDSATLMQDILHDGERLHVLRDDALELPGCYLLTLDSNGTGDAHAPYLQEQQLQRLAARLQALHGKPLLMALHHPLLPTGVPWIDEQMRVQNGERVHDLLRQEPRLRAVLHGHIHQSTITIRDGINYISCPSTWSNLAAYPGLQVDECAETTDPLTAGGFNLVMLRGESCFLRRYSLPLLVD